VFRNPSPICDSAYLSAIRLTEHIPIKTQGSRKCRNIGLQKYIGRLKELKRIQRRHSAFWISLYGCLWVGVMEFWDDLAGELIRLRKGKLPYFHKGLRAMTLIQSTL
jgi:hypothetical protein